MATFSDNFNRADSGSLGANWIEGLNAGSGFQVASNQILGLGSESGAVWGTAADTDNNWAQITAVAISTATAGAFARSNASTGSNSHTAYFGCQTASVAAILKRVNGTYTSLGSTSRTGVNGDVIRLECSGSTITNYINTVQQVQVTDTSITTGKYVGVRTNRTAALLDDWSGGDLSTATQLVAQDASHAHSAESPTLVQHHLLAADDTLHGHTAESPTLVQHHLLAADDALHAHTAGNVALVQHHILTVDNAAHAHAADTVVWTVPWATLKGTVTAARPAVATVTAARPARATVTAARP